MKKILIAFILILIFKNSNAQHIPYDKKLHFSAGFVIGGTTASFSKKPILSAFVSSLIVGTSKEIYDKVSKRGTPEINDVYATVIGGVASGLIVSFFKTKIFIKKNK